MRKRDYYEVLGVSQSDSANEIKKSYRQAALKYHPDKNPGDPVSEEKFKEATEAYQILSNADSRAKYDQFGHAAFQGQGGAGFEFGDFSHFAEDIFGDIFGAFFGSQGGRRGSRGGRDLRYNLQITLEEAAAGVEKTIKFDKAIVCEECAGSGAKKGTTPEVCKQCNGNGQVHIQQGFFTISRPCPVCSGSGRMIVNPCENCGGQGQVKKPTELAVKVPAGIDEGQQLKLNGEGEVSPSGGPPGNLFVQISIAPHKRFIRQGTAILCEVPVTYTQAVLGAEIEVPTLDGTSQLKIPTGTQAGKTFRLKGQGIPDIRNGHRGDQHVQVLIHVPKTIDDKQRELLQQLAEVEGQPVLEDGKSFIDKVRDFFERENI